MWLLNGLELNFNKINPLYFYVGIEFLRLSLFTPLLNWSWD